MRIRSLLLAVSCIVAAGAVMVEDAFKRDWVHHSYGSLRKVTLLDHQTLLGLSSNNLLYGIGSNAEIKYFIDLPKHGHTDFTVLSTLIVAFGSDNSVSLFDKSSGVFITSLTLPATPLQFDEVTNGTDLKGLLVLSRNGDLLLWNKGSVRELGVYNTGYFIQYSDSTQSIVSIDSSEIVLKFGNDGVIQSTEIETSKQPLPPAQALPEASEQILQSSSRKFVKELLLDVSKQSMSIAQKTTSGFKLIDEKEVGKVLDIQVHGSAAVVPSEQALQVFDFSELLKSDSKKEFTLTQLRAFPGFISSYVDAEKVTVLTVNTTQAVLTTVNLKTKKESSVSIALSTLSASGKAIIVDMPPSLSKIHEIHELAEVYHSTSLLHRLFSRYNKHLSALGHAAAHIFQKQEQSVEADEDKYGFEKVLVFDDKDEHTLAAKSTKDGRLLWTFEYQSSQITNLVSSKSKLFVFSNEAAFVLDVRTGSLVSELAFSAKDDIFKLSAKAVEEDILDSTAVVIKSGNALQVLEDDDLEPDQHIVSNINGRIQSFVVAGKSLIPTWDYYSPDEEVICFTKNTEQLTVAAGISRSDRSVLYKYLNPNLVSLITRHKQSGAYKVTLLDGITGVVIHAQEHNEEIDPSSVQLVMSDNWVIYSYFVLSPKRQQRVVVVDLFEERPKTSERSAFTASDVQVSTKSFIYPERILSLACTKTQFGITIRSVLALTESGSLVEIPKFLLNSRRVSDRPMTKEDYSDDFQMSPYDPLLMKNTFQVLNHKNKLQIGEVNHILSQPTDLESTSVVCLANAYNEFCTVVQPSLSYDLLQSSFAKSKLLITIVVLLAGYLVTKPFVYSKKLNANWEG